MMITLKSDIWNGSLCQGLENLRQKKLFCDVLIRTCADESQCSITDTTDDSSGSNITGLSKYCVGEHLPANNKGRYDIYPNKGQSIVTRSRMPGLTFLSQTTVKASENNKSAAEGVGSKVKCGCIELKAHSAVLGASSSVLQEALKVSELHYHCNTVMKIIYFEEISSALWNIVLKFMYLGVVNIQDYFVHDLKNVAEKLRLKDLTKALLSCIIKSPSIANNVRAPGREHSMGPKDVQCEINDNMHDHDVPQQTIDTQDIDKIKFSTGNRFVSYKRTRSANVLKSHTVKARKKSKKSCENMVFETENKASVDILKSVDTIEDALVANLIKTETAEKSLLSEQEEFQTVPPSQKLLKFENAAVDAIIQDSDREVDIVETSSEAVDCPICGKIFKSKTSMKTHQLVIHATKCSLTCDKCRKRFYRRQDLVVHQRIHTGEKPYACSFCTKKFSQKQNMKIHEKTHLNEKNFECDICGRTFLRKWGLQEHEKTHSGEKPFLCQTCGKSFSKISNLQVHERIHSGVKPYSCACCLLTFNDPSTYKQHLVVHQDRKMHQCSTCGVQFSRAKSLKEHERIHTGEKPHKCPDCSAAFANTSNLSRHRKCHKKKDKHRKQSTDRKDNIDLKTPVKEELDLSVFLKTPNLSDFSFSKFALDVCDTELLNTSKNSHSSPLKRECESSRVRTNADESVLDSQQVTASLDTNQPNIQQGDQRDSCEKLDKNIVLLNNSELKSSDIPSNQNYLNPSISGNEQYLLNYGNLSYSFASNGICFQIAGSNLV